jgi:hypothetical protein
MNSSSLPSRGFSHARKQQTNKYEQPYSGPYRITQVNTNGTVCLKINAVMDTVNIQCIHPFKTSNSNRGGECSMCRAKDR